MSGSNFLVTTENLDHLGIVAGILKQIGLRDRVNQTLGAEARVTERLTVGDCVCAMIINSLGFANRTLYLTEHFFKNKPLDLLIAPGLTAEDFTDDSLAKSLDIIFMHDPSLFYAKVAYSIAISHGVLDRTRLMDSTSISLEGSYKDPATNANDGLEGALVQDDAEPGTISITYGHSKQHRSDLVQFMLQMVHSGGKGFPLWMEALSGNSSDKTSFHETIERVHNFERQLQLPQELIWIADSALYSKKHLLQKEVGYKWLTRVPETLSEAAKMVSMPDCELDWQTYDDRYSYVSFDVNVCEIKQRWVMFYSSESFDREHETFQRKLEKEKKEVDSKLWHLGNKPFACAPDAEKALRELMKKHPMFNVSHNIETKDKYSSRGKPKKGELPVKTEFYIKAVAAENEGLVSQKLNTKGRFILATNELDKQKLSDEEMLSEYKGLSNVERGFRFLKDPWFMADQIFLKKKSRIAALMAVMTLTLLTYSLGERQLRETLAKRNETLPNQLKKEIANPTLRWVFQMMDGISRVNIPQGSEKMSVISNLSDVHLRIIQLFGKEVMEIYGRFEELKKRQIRAKSKK